MASSWEFQHLISYFLTLIKYMAITQFDFENFRKVLWAYIVNIMKNIVGVIMRPICRSFEDWVLYFYQCNLTFK